MDINIQIFSLQQTTGKGGMISQTAEYALRAMVFLAENPGNCHPVTRIARHTQVPAGYLSKVLKGLVEAGFVESQRGPGGGFCLGKPADRISLLDIVNSVSPITRIHACPLGLAHHQDHLCALHQQMDDAIRQFETRFKETRLSQLLEPEAGGTFRGSDSA